MSTIRTALTLLGRGEFSETARRVVPRVYQRWLSVGLTRELHLPFESPAAKVPLTVRPLAPRDLPLLFATDGASPGAERGEIAERERLVEAGVPFCFVAATSGDEPCYMQWLYGAEDNERIAALFDRRFPALRRGEGLLEGAFTPARWRGQGIMPAAMARIAEEAARRGFERLITFVAIDNIPSLKGCERAGFRPTLVRDDRWVLTPRFRRISFLPWHPRLAPMPATPARGSA